MFLRISAGEEAAFQALFHLYVPEITPVIVGLLASQAHLKDIVQEIFLDIWLNRDKLPFIEKPRNWIFRLTYNRCYGWLEKQQVRDRARQRLQQESAPALTPVDGLLFRETVACIQQAIRELPPQACQIYTMSRNEGLTIAEIAQQLGIAPQSVKNSLYRSGILLRQYLAAKGFEVP